MMPQLLIPRRLLKVPTWWYKSTYVCRTVPDLCVEHDHAHICRHTSTRSNLQSKSRASAHKIIRSCQNFITTYHTMKDSLKNDTQDPATAAAGTDEILGSSTKRTLEKYDLVSADNSAPGASLMAKDLNKANKQVVAVEKDKKSEYYQLYTTYS